jgi:hypothetical protein
MIIISYNLGCRNCLQSDGVRHITTLEGADLDEYRRKTEFEVMTQVENWRVEDGLTCKFCGSPNVEILDIHISDFPLYNYDNLVSKCKIKREYMLIINIVKDGSNIKLSHGGSEEIMVGFVESAIQKIISTINSRPTNQFTSQQKGNFFVCITGGYDIFDDKANVRLERFKSFGLTQNEIFNEIRPLAEQVDISI